ncbi:GumC family protein [Gracilimonas sp.]|uniref:GumC family protein n=1 Tax=Gracilimonas sp. TaxID=1974203 RepID=UPI00287167EF|nr:GNVR domain-containing protein [Gracilimonas sp.]
MNSNYSSPEWIEIARELYKNKIKIVVLVFAVSVIVAIFSLFLNNKYKSTANLLPNPSRGIGFDLFAEEGGLQGIASSFLGGQSDEANRFYIILESYTVKKEVVEKFNLIERYETSEAEDPLRAAILTLEDHLNFESKEEGNFIIDVWDTDPDTAKMIADFLIEKLNTRSTTIATREASKYRDFIETRYQKSITEFDSLSTELKSFQQKYGVLELPTQVEQYFSVIASLSTAKYRAEIELNLLEETVNTSSTAYQNALNQYQTISKKLEEVYSDTLPDNIELNFTALPEISNRYMWLMQEVEIQKEIQKFLVPVYEQAKMEEAKALPIVSVVDEPVVPVLKDKPKRMLIVLMAAISALILCFLYYVAVLSFRKNNDLIHRITNQD